MPAVVLLGQPVYGQGVAAPPQARPYGVPSAGSANSAASRYNAAVPGTDLNWSRQPVGLQEPLDPVTGLPLHMVNLSVPYGASDPTLPVTVPPATVAPSDSSGVAVAPPPVPVPMPDSSWARARAEFYNRPSPGRPNAFVHSTQTQPDVTEPGVQQQPTAPLVNPVVFEGRIEPIARSDSASGFSSFDLPIPKIDPPLPEMGNNDGILDFYDLIEEYGGRATRSDMPAEPHMAHPEDRSWLRIEGWRMEASWLGGQDDDLGIASAHGSLALGLPKIKGVTVRPRVAAYWLDGPTSTDLPSRLFDGEIEGVWMHRFNDRFRAHASVVAGVYSDLDTGSGMMDAFRLSGSGIGAIEVHPDLQVVLGAAYFNLGSVWLWPVAGVVWQPNDCWRLELIFPEGRVSCMTEKNEAYTERLFVGARFFGRTWQVTRTTGMRELVTYQDWRVMGGVERYYLWGVTTFIQGGLSFGRKLEYRTGIGDFDPDPVALVQAGLYF